MKRFIVSKSAVSGAGDVPEWVTWFPEGRAVLENGPEYWVNEKSWEKVKANIDRRGLEIVVDYEHQTLSGGIAPAAGWCKEWRYVPGTGIQARVEWTAKAKELLNAGEYRYFSPVFEMEKDEDGAMALCRVHNLALTNDPRTNNLKAIVAKMEKTGENMDLLKQLAALLGMAETATEEEVMAEIGLLLEKVKKAPEMEEAKEVIKEVIPAKLAAALGINSGASVDMIVAKIKGMQAAGGHAADMAARLAELEEQAKKAKAKELMTVYAAKLSPAMRSETGADGRPYWESLAEDQPEIFIQVAKNLPDAVPGPLPAKSMTVKSEQLSEAEVKVAKMFGNTPEEYVKYNKDLQV